MSYDTIEIEDMDWSEELQAFTYQCPCGDLFQITLVRLASPSPYLLATEACCNVTYMPL
jgi:CSL zinc finger